MVIISDSGMTECNYDAMEEITASLISKWNKMELATVLLHLTAVVLPVSKQRELSGRSMYAC